MKKQFQITLTVLERIPENVDALVKMWTVFTSERINKEKRVINWKEAYRISTLHSVRGCCKWFNRVVMTSIQTLTPEKATDM